MAVTKDEAAREENQQSAKTAVDAIAAAKETLAKANADIEQFTVPMCEQFHAHETAIADLLDVAASKMADALAPFSAIEDDVKLQSLRASLGQTLANALTARTAAERHRLHAGIVETPPEAKSETKE